MRYWCLSTSKENWPICKRNSVWGMDARYYITLERYMKAGDQAVVYTSKDQAFVAAVEFYGDFFYDPTDIGWTKGGRPFIFPYRIKFKILKESINPPTISFSLDEDNNGKAFAC